MRLRYAGIIALVATLVLTGCDRLMPYRNAEPVDVDALVALLPDTISASYDAVEFNKRQGVTSIINLTLVPAGNPEAGIRIGRTNLRDINIEAIGKLTADTGASVLQQLSDQLAGNAPSETFDQIAGLVSFRRLESFGIGDGDLNIRFSYGALTYRNIEMKPFRLGVGAKVAQAIASFADSLKIEEMNGRNAAATVATKDSGTLNLRINRDGFKDFDRGSIRVSRSQGLFYELDLTALTGLLAAYTGDSSTDDEEKIANWIKPLESLESVLTMAAAAQPNRISYRIGSTQTRDLDVSSLLPYIIADQLPPVTETELVDLGRSVTRNVSYAVEGKDAGGADAYYVDSAKFHWLIPSDIRYRVENERATALSYGEAPQVAEAMAAMGITEIIADWAFNWLWNAQSGVLDIDSNWDAEDLLEYEGGVTFGGLVFEALASAAADANGGGVDLGVVAGITFDRGRIILIDESTVEKIVAYIAVQSGMSVDEVRQSAQAFIGAFGPSITGDSERGARVLQAASSFLDQGGTLRIMFEPNTPAPLLELQALANNPPALIERLGLDGDHIPPEAEE